MVGIQRACEPVALSLDWLLVVDASVWSDAICMTSHFRRSVLDLWRRATGTALCALVLCVCVAACVSTHSKTM